MAKKSLNRFKKAQEDDFFRAYNEILSGKKKSCWMWYIFPQLKELGYSYMSKFYGIDGYDEAKAFLNDKYLGNHLRQITAALLGLKKKNIRKIMGRPDDEKLRSSMTLFYAVAESEADRNLFKAVIDKYFNGIFCVKTKQILEGERLNGKNIRNSRR